MFRKTAILWVMLMSVLVASAYAQGSADFTGNVKGASTSVVDGKFEIVLNLEEYPNNTFYISLEDAPKFGLSKDVEIKTGDEFGQFTGNLEKLKGRKVKLSCLKMTEYGGQGYRVKALERLNGK